MALVYIDSSVLVSLALGPRAWGSRAGDAWPKELSPQVGCVYPGPDRVRATRRGCLPREHVDGDAPRGRRRDQRRRRRQLRPRRDTAQQHRPTGQLLARKARQARRDPRPPLQPPGPCGTRHRRECRGA